MTADWNDNTEHDRYYDGHVVHHVITRNCVGHVTRSRLLTGLLAFVCLTMCSLLTHCVSVTSSGQRGCHGEVKVIGQVVINDIGTVQYTSTRHHSSDDEPVQRLPQCLIIGVRKGGTRALLEFLSLHPDVRIQKQELHFFDDEQTYSLGLDWYRRQMPYTTSPQLTVEKTPGYFIGDDVPDRVRAMNKSIKLLLIVRDPVERAISDYAQLHAARLRRGKYHARFEDLAIDPLTGEVEKSYRAIRRSKYCLDMARWLSTFDLHQFHFVNGEQLVTNPVSELRQVETFLGLKHLINDSMFYFNDSRGFYCIKAPPITPMGGASNSSTNANRSLVKGVDGVSTLGTNRTTLSSERCLASSKGRIHPNISIRVVHKLRSFFRPFNEIFYKQTAINFSWPIT